MGNNTYTATGGSGAGYHARINITEGGYYTVVVGGGGLAVGSGHGGSPTGGNGAATTITSPSNVTLISAGGGTGGRSGPVWATRGSGGTLSKNASLSELVVYTNTNGNNGGSYAGGSAPGVNGAAGPLSGHTWGASGYAKGNYSGGRANASYHGYMYIKFLGNMVTYTITPTPSDATVTLTASGYTQQGNSITVLSGTTITWSVSKAGYVGAAGTATISADKNQSVVLSQADPDLYCFQGSDGNYYYFPTNPLDW